MNGLFNGALKNFLIVFFEYSRNIVTVKIELEKNKAMDVPIALYDRKTQKIYQQKSDGTKIVVADRIRKGRYSERIREKA